MGLLCLLGASVPTPPPAAGAAPDTARTAGLATGYDELQRRYRSWRRIGGTDPTLHLGLLVVDETVSKLGADFYRAFHQAWTPPSVEGDYAITVREQPLPNRGTRVAVRVNGRIAAQFRLQPRTAQIEQAARYAATRTARFIQSGRGQLRIE